MGEGSGTSISKSADTRLAHNDFFNSEARLENSLKFLPIWSEAFVITSIAWTFGPIFNKRARKELAEALKVKILECKSDFGTYQKLKKKAGVEKQQEGKDGQPPPVGRRVSHGSS